MAAQQLIACERDVMAEIELGECKGLQPLHITRDGRKVNYRPFLVGETDSCTGTLRKMIADGKLIYCERPSHAGWYLRALADMGGVAGIWSMTTHGATWLRKQYPFQYHD